MTRIAGEVLIDRPVEDVFDFVADERNEPSYNRDMLRCELLTAGPVGPGSRFAAVHRGRRRPVQMVVEVTEYDRPRRLVSTTRMPVAEVRGVLRFEPVGSATQMYWDWDVCPKRVAWLSAPLVRVVGARQERACWLALKRYLEAETPALPTSRSRSRLDPGSGCINNFATPHRRP